MILGSPGKVGRCQDFAPQSRKRLRGFFFSALCYSASDILSLPSPLNLSTFASSCFCGSGALSALSVSPVSCVLTPWGPLLGQAGKLVPDCVLYMFGARRCIANYVCNFSLHRMYKIALEVPRRFVLDCVVLRGRIFDLLLLCGSRAVGAWPQCMGVTLRSGIVLRVIMNVKAPCIASESYREHRA